MGGDGVETRLLPEPTHEAAERQLQQRPDPEQLLVSVAANM